MRKVIAIHAFYKNKVPGGFGIMWNCPTGFAKELLEGIEGYKDFIKPDPGETQDEFAAFMIRQLDYFGEAKKSRLLDKAEQVIAVQNTYWLEQHGYLKADEFNGMQFHFTEDRISDGQHRLGRGVVSVMTIGEKLVDCGIEEPKDFTGTSSRQAPGERHRP